MPFEKGQSGNPAGRPPKVVEDAQRSVLLELCNEAEERAIVRNMIANAKRKGVLAAPSATSAATWLWDRKDGKVKHEIRRFNVLACGRRWGKTTFGMGRLVPPALEGYPVAWFSPTYNMLTEVWRTTVQTLTPVIRRMSVQEHRLELITGGIVDMWSLDTPDVARGRKYRRIAVYEAAMIRDLLLAWQQVIRPTLADYEGDADFHTQSTG